MTFKEFYEKNKEYISFNIENMDFWKKAALSFWYCTKMAKYYSLNQIKYQSTKYSFPLTVLNILEESITNKSIDTDYYNFLKQSMELEDSMPNYEPNDVLSSNALDYYTCVYDLIDYLLSKKSDLPVTCCMCYIECVSRDIDELYNLYEIIDYSSERFSETILKYPEYNDAITELKKDIEFLTNYSQEKFLSFKKIPLP